MTADDGPRPLGLLVEQGRGPLPFLLLDGEPLVAYAGRALVSAGLEPVDVGTPWDDVVDADAPLVLHDPLCPLTPADFLASCARTAAEDDVVVVGQRPVTDTVKQVKDGQLGATVDRDELQVVCSPLVLPARLVAGLTGLPGEPGHDFAAMVADLVGAGEQVRYVEAPARARRVTDADEVRLLEALAAG